MKEKTKKANKLVQESQELISPVADVNTYVVQDLRTSLLFVSILINVIILITWIAVQVTTAYDAQLLGLLVIR